MSDYDETGTAKSGDGEHLPLDNAMPHISPKTADPQNLDPGFADVLARAAALPDLAGEHHDPEDDVDELIRLVVAKSNRRISFPEPGQARVAGQPTPEQPAFLPLVLDDGIVHRLPVHSVLAAARDPLMVVARTSPERFTVFFRAAAERAAGEQRPQLQAEETASRLLRAIADDVGRRLNQQPRPQQLWQLSIAVVADTATSRHFGTSRSSTPWWTASFLYEDFARLLGQRTEADGCRVLGTLTRDLLDEAAPLWHQNNTLRTGAGRLLSRWELETLCGFDAYPRMTPSFYSSWLRRLVYRARNLGASCGCSRDGHNSAPAEATWISHMLPQPPPAPAPTRAQREEEKPRFKVLLDRELAEAGGLR